eukprot:UN04563
MKRSVNCIFSIHSFNPVYESQIRDFEVGILCTSATTEARVIGEYLTLQGFETRINEPWSGKDGFMYSADSLKAALGGQPKSIMVEARNDKAQDT